MPQIKIFLWVLIDTLGLGTGVLAFINNLDNWKAGFTFVVFIVYAYLRAVSWWEDIRKKRIENADREWELSQKKKPKNLDGDSTKKSA